MKTEKYRGYTIDLETMYGFYNACSDDDCDAHILSSKTLDGLKSDIDEKILDDTFSEAKAFVLSHINDDFIGGITENDINSERVTLRLGYIAAICQDYHEMMIKKGK